MRRGLFHPCSVGLGRLWVDASQIFQRGRRSVGVWHHRKELWRKWGNEQQPICRAGRHLFFGRGERGAERFVNAE